MIGSLHPMANPCLDLSEYLLLSVSMGGSGEASYTEHGLRLMRLSMFTDATHPPFRAVSLDPSSNLGCEALLVLDWPAATCAKGPEWVS